MPLAVFYLMRLQHARCTLPTGSIRPFCALNARACLRSLFPARLPLFAPNPTVRIRLGAICALLLAGQNRAVAALLAGPPGPGLGFPGLLALKPLKPQAPPFAATRPDFRNALRTLQPDGGRLKRVFPSKAARSNSDYECRGNPVFGAARPKSVQHLQHLAGTWHACSLPSRLPSARALTSPDRAPLATGRRAALSAPPTFGLRCTPVLSAAPGQFPAAAFRCKQAYDGERINTRHRPHPDFYRD